MSPRDRGAVPKRFAADPAVWWTGLRVAAAVLFVLGAVAAVRSLVYPGHRFLDAWVYFGGGQHLVHGQDVYDPAGIALPVPPSPLPFTYPPFAALSFAGLFAGHFGVGIVLLSGLGLAGLAAMCLLVARGLNPDVSRAAVLGLGAFGVGLALEPVRQTLSYGQINLVLTGLVAVDCLARRTWWPRGVLIGVAAAIKLTPAAFVLYFVARREWKQARTAVLSFLVCTGLGWLVTPGGSVTYWFHDMLDSGRVGPVAFVTNESLRGSIERTVGHGGPATGLWLVAALLTVGAALVTATRLRAVGEHVLAWVTVAVAVTLISPVSWSHHWVWVAGALLAVGYRAAQRRSWLGLALTAFATWVFWVGAHWLNFDIPPQSWTLWMHVREEGYVLVAVGFLALITAVPRWFVAPAETSRVPGFGPWIFRRALTPASATGPRDLAGSAA